MLARTRRIAAALALAAPVHAQSVLHTLVGDSQGGRFGQAVSGVGDLNGDGFGDFAVGQPQYDGRGRVLVYSGLDAQELWSVQGPQLGGLFGYAVCGVPDLDGDALMDVLVGAPYEDSNGDFAGTLYLLSGATGGVLRAWPGLNAGEGHGWSVDSAGDVDGDGVLDVVAGAPKADTRGALRVWSGADGSLLRDLHRNAVQGFLGGDVAGVGDWDGDGRADLAAGELGYDGQRGRITVFSGTDGSILRVFLGEAQGERLGESIASAGDVDGDGVQDLVAGALSSENGDRAGSARVWSGADGALLYTFLGSAALDYFGFHVEGMGDVDGDGRSDVAVSSYPFLTGGRGTIRVFSGRTGRVLFAPDPDDHGDIGPVVGRAGDVNGDGYADVLDGAVDTGIFGWVRVYSGCDVIGARYCSPAVGNSTGLPARLESCGSTVVDQHYLVLHARDLPHDQAGYFLAGTAPDFQTPPGSQGNLCVGGAIQRFAAQVQSSGADGAFALRLPWVPDGGDTWYFQAWFRDRDPGPTSNFTDAVSVSFL